MKTHSLLLGVLLAPFAVVMGSSADAEQVTMTVVYDNYVFTQGTTADWGFGCFIEGSDETILFDTGYQGSILMDNIDMLGVDLDAMDMVVISHDHLDHTGGLDSVLNRNPDVSVYFGASFPQSFAQNIIDHGATPVPVDSSIAFCYHVYSTGELQGPVNEQSLILEADEGLVVITGCSHPGIVNILTTAKELLDKDIYLVFGGFHLMQHSVAQINQIIQDFRDLGVQKVGPTHCTGETAISLFQQEYGDDFMQMGTGRTITVSMTPVPAHDETGPGSHMHNRPRIDRYYPNPFSAETVVCYYIPTESQVELATYNSCGQRLVTLVDDRKNTGAHSAVWNASEPVSSDLASGVFFCRLRVGDFVDTIPVTRVE